MQPNLSSPDRKLQSEARLRTQTIWGALVLAPDCVFHYVPSWPRPETFQSLSDDSQRGTCPTSEKNILNENLRPFPPGNDAFEQHPGSCHSCRPVRKNLMVFTNRKATNGPVESDSSSGYRVQNTPRGTTPRCYSRGGMLRNISNGFNWKKKLARFRPGSSRIEKLRLQNTKFDRNVWGSKTAQQRG